MRVRAFTLALAAATVAGCALDQPPLHEDVLQRALPEDTVIPPAWASRAASGPVADDWQSLLDDPPLQAIIAEAIAHNPDLLQAAERVIIAQQQVLVVGAQLLPQLDGNLGALTSRFEHSHGYSKVYSSFATVSWELDVWGRLRAQRDAAGAIYEATALDYSFARQSLAATVARSWYLASETRQLLALAERSVEIYSELATLVSVRRNAGKDSDLDVYDTRANLESAQSALKRAQQEFGEARRALEVLLGRYPAAEIEALAEFPLMPPPPAAGVPAALLERRPDLVAAEREVLAAFRLEESARLALLPDISAVLLGGHLGSLSDALAFENPWVESASIGAAIPIYAGGALRAQIEIATAQQAQAVARYGSVLLEAFREVEDTLANDLLLTEREPLSESALRDRTETVRIATEQYQAGRQDLLWVSTLQNNQIATEEGLIKLRGLRRTNRIRLLLALGGSYDATPAVPTAPAAVP